jgi:hypothetical protein
MKKFKNCYYYVCYNEQVNHKCFVWKLSQTNKQTNTYIHSGQAMKIEGTHTEINVEGAIEQIGNLFIYFLFPYFS